MWPGLTLASRRDRVTVVEVGQASKELNATCTHTSTPNTHTLLLGRRLVVPYKHGRRGWITLARQGVKGASRKARHRLRGLGVTCSLSALSIVSVRGSGNDRGTKKQEAVTYKLCK